MELEYYTVGGSYGWNQEKFTDPMMKGGGCAAVTACDSLIYFSKYMGLTECCPIETSEITIKSYKAFSRVMKPYLRPRWQGIDSLDIYIEGLTDYLRDIGENRISIRGFSGKGSLEEAKKIVKSQIDKKYRCHVSISSIRTVSSRILNGTGSCLRDIGSAEMAARTPMTKKFLQAARTQVT